MHFLKLSLLLLMLTLPGINQAWAHTNIHRVISARDGLMFNGAVQHINFDDQGFAWIASEYGLYRVTQSRARRVDVGGQSVSPQTFSGRPFWRVFPITSSMIFATTEEGTLLFDVRDNRMKALGSDLFPSFGTALITDMKLAADGSYRVMTEEGELWRFDPAAMTMEFMFKAPVEDEFWLNIQAFRGAWILVGKHNLLLVNDDGELERKLWESDSIRLRSLYQADDGTLWAATSDGLASLKLPTLELNFEPGVPQSLYSLTQDNEGTFWFATSDGLLAWKQGEELKTYYADLIFNQADISTVYTVTRDPSGLIWAGGNGKGVVLLAPDPDYVLDSISSHDTYQIPLNVSWSMISDNNHLWLAAEGGLHYIDRENASFESVLLEGLSRDDQVYDIAWLDQNNLLTLTTNGLYRVNGDSLESQTLAAWSGHIPPEEIDWATVLYSDPVRQGRVWLAGYKGLYYWHPGERRILPVDWGKYGPPGDTGNINFVKRDSQGRLWIGGNQVFGYFDRNLTGFTSLASLTKVEDSDIELMNMLELSPGKFWLGSAEHGVFEFDGERVNSLKSQVPCTTVFFMGQTQNYSFIGCTSSLITQRKGSDSFMVHSRRSGLPVSEFNQGAFELYQNDKLYVGTTDGVLLLDVGVMQAQPRSDRLFIEAIQVMDTDAEHLDILPGESVKLAAGTEVISIQLSAASFWHVEPPDLQYRLLERRGRNEPGYLPLNGQTLLTLNNLHPGDYVLEVLQRQDGVWSESPVLFQFAIDFEWWQTTWFRMLVFACVLALLAFVFWIRQQQLNRVKAMNVELQAGEEKLLQALKGSDSELWEWHADMDRLFLSNRTGLLGESQMLVLRPQSVRLFPDDQQEYEQLCSGLRSGELQKFETEFRYLNPQGEVAWMRVMGKSLFDHSGKLQQVLGIFSDITAIRELQNKASLLARAFEYTAEGVLILDHEQNISVANRSAISLLGESLEGRAFKSLLTIPNLDEELFREVTAQSGWSGELEFALPEMSCPVWLNASAMCDGNNKAMHYVMVFSDIRERKRSEADLRRLANYDMLTGLPNRTLFGARLMKAILQAGKNDEKLALLFMDLDRFKHVNDSYGHGMGDALLVEAASRLHACMETEHTLCRFGGDEFVVLARDADNLDNVNRLAETILRQMTMPFELYGREFHLSASIGISVWPDDANQPEALIKNADQAMYHAKDEGRCNFQYYSSERNAEALYHLKLEAELRKALENGDFELYFQPQINIRERTERLVGIEALLRWHHATEGYIRPDIFVAIAESCGLVKQLDLWVLREACTQGRKWCQIAPDDFYVAVNISAVHFRSRDFVSGVHRILLETGMKPENLELEITEGVLMKEVSVAQEHLRKLADLGVKVAIDDFGTGYSSLAYLRHFSVNSLKIDRTFFIDIVEHVSDQAIVSSIVELARNLKLDVVAEGVETEEQLEQAFIRGCYTIQGYYYAKPMPVPEMDAYLRQHSFPPASDVAN